MQRYFGIFKIASYVVLLLAAAAIAYAGFIIIKYWGGISV